MGYTDVTTLYMHVLSKSRREMHILRRDKRAILEHRLEAVVMDLNYGKVNNNIIFLTVKMGR